MCMIMVEATCCLNLRERQTRKPFHQKRLPNKELKEVWWLTQVRTPETEMQKIMFRKKKEQELEGIREI